MIKHILLAQRYTGDETNTAYNVYPSYQVTNLKYSSADSSDAVYVGQSYSVKNMLNSYFVNNEFFQSSDIQTGTYSGSGSLNTPGSVETTFHPNLVYVYGPSEQSGYSVIAILYPKLGYGKMFYVTSASSEALNLKSYAHGLKVEYSDGVTSFYNGFVNGKTNTLVMDTQLNRAGIIYNWVAFG